MSAVRLQDVRDIAAGLDPSIEVTCEAGAYVLRCGRVHERYDSPEEAIAGLRASWGTRSAAPLDWRDPPARRRGRDQAPDMAVRDALRERPGQWAVIHVAKSLHTASTYATYRRANWGPDFELVARQLEVFARFVGVIEIGGPS